MLVFGGFTSRLVSSRELWMYSRETEEWRQLESAVSSVELLKMKGREKEREG